MAKILNCYCHHKKVLLTRGHDFIMLLTAKTKLFHLGDKTMSDARRCLYKKEANYLHHRMCHMTLVFTEACQPPWEHFKLHTRIICNYKEFSPN